ncbi:SERINE/ARGININE-RICH SPLICING FACTOR [Salix viminalis]|uniref:SERINE/ARGININE-RICH SPLICING FACTOR n=1 Tax=Salix viminalis TaxID=40686 RepID=A0A9Q0YXJ6_SALVM|nr:SERINE/ARGININE-RICH SPLICING FACTOR [Salix viminalis]
MAQLDLTVQVLNLSPSVTRIELITFFSYCGTVEKIELQKDKDRLQSALVTFTQPYAFQTALLLNVRKDLIFIIWYPCFSMKDALLGGKPIRILPAHDIEIPITGPDISKWQNYGSSRFVPAVQGAIQTVALKSFEILGRTRELEENCNCNLSERGRTLAIQSRAAIRDAGQAAENYVSAGAGWLSGALDKTSKSVLELGSVRWNDPNLKKQK